MEKKFVLCATKKINVLTLVLTLSEKKILNETKNHNTPMQVKWSVPKCNLVQYKADIYPHLIKM